MIDTNENMDEENDIENVVEQDLEEFKLEKYITDENKVPLQINQTNEDEEEYNTFTYWKLQPSKETENKLLEEIGNFN